jgi:tellurite resistance protein TehA-like permease
MRTTGTGGAVMRASTGTSSLLGEGQSAASVRNLPPAAFSFVMATGIISSAGLSLGPQWLSRFLLVLACAGLALLSLALVVRVVRFPSAVLEDVRRPERVFGFFTIVAGLDVVGIRLASAGHPSATAWLAAIAAAVWVVLTYAVPAHLLLTRPNDSVLGGVNGTWLLWVVGTQSLAIAAAALVKPWPGQAGLLAPVSVALWSVGLVLYLLLVSLILLRWLTVPMTPGALGPPYWILMGATAITVRAGAQILALPVHLPIRLVSGHFVSGFSFALWAFGTWWIPLLIVLGLWRHLVHHWPLTYETALWSVVFPLGMYSAATLTFGAVAHLSFMEPIARVMFWVAVAAWTGVAVSGIWQVVRPSASAQPAPALES